MNKPISPQTMAAMSMGVAVAAGVPEGDLVYVTEKKIMALYPTLDLYSVHLAVKDAMNCWLLFKNYLEVLDVPTAGLQ